MLGRKSRAGVKILTCGDGEGSLLPPSPPPPPPPPRKEETFRKEHSRALRNAQGMARNSVWLEQGGAETGGRGWGLEVRR